MVPCAGERIDPEFAGGCGFASRKKKRMKAAPTTQTGAATIANHPGFHWDGNERQHYAESEGYRQPTDHFQSIDQ